MAGALVTIEKRLYADAGVADGDVWRTLVLRRRLQESPDTVSFVLGTSDGSALPRARPGQYVSVQVTLPDGARQIRQYSITRSFEPSEWGISVKAVPMSHADDGTIIPAGEVSNFLHHNLFEGDEIRASAPFGDLVVEDSNQPSHRQELKQLVAAMPTASLHRWYENLGIRPTRDVLRAGRVDLGTVEIPTDAQIYLCRPLPFMESVRSSLIEQNVREADIHYEVFGPDKWLASA